MPPVDPRFWPPPYDRPPLRSAGQMPSYGYPPAPPVHAGHPSAPPTAAPPQGAPSAPPPYGQPVFR
jgi:hypothetical protein